VEDSIHIALGKEGALLQLQYFNQHV